MRTSITPGMLRLLRMRKKRDLQKRMNAAGDYFMAEVEKIKARGLVNVLQTHEPKFSPTLDIWKGEFRKFDWGLDAYKKRIDENQSTPNQ